MEIRIPAWTPTTFIPVKPSKGLNYDELARTFAKFLWEESASGFTDVLRQELIRYEAEFK